MVEHTRIKSIYQFNMKSAPHGALLDSNVGNGRPSRWQQIKAVIPRIGRDRKN